MKTHIKVLGPGCPKCKTLEKITQEVVTENQFDAEVSKVEDIMQIMGYGVVGTPGLVINEKVILSGRLPSKAEVEGFIRKSIDG